MADNPYSNILGGLGGGLLGPMGGALGGGIGGAMDAPDGYGGVGGMGGAVGGGVGALGGGMLGGAAGAGLGALGANLMDGDYDDYMIPAGAIGAILGSAIGGGAGAGYLGNESVQDQMGRENWRAVYDDLARNPISPQMDDYEDEYEKQSMTDSNMVTALGALGYPIGGAIAGPLGAAAIPAIGAAMTQAPGERMGPALGAGAGGVLGGTGGGLVGGLGGGLLGYGAGRAYQAYQDPSFMDRLLGNDFGDEDVLMAALAGGAGGSLLGGAAGGGLGARTGFELAREGQNKQKRTQRQLGQRELLMQMLDQGQGQGEGQEQAQEQAKAAAYANKTYKGQGDYKQNGDYMTKQAEVAVCFAGGAFVKCAEANANPQAVYDYAVRVGDARLAKVAAAATAFSRLPAGVKQAFLGKMMGRVGDAVGSAGARLGGSFKALGDAGEQVGAFRRAGSKAKELSGQADEAVAKGHRMADDLDMLKQKGVRGAHDGRVVQDVRQNAIAQANKAEGLQGDAAALRHGRMQDLKAYGKQVAPAVGVLGAGAGTAGLGAAGLGAYAAGDADTTGNKMKQFANQNLGMNFDTQSRLGALFG